MDSSVRNKDYYLLCSGIVVYGDASEFVSLVAVRPRILLTLLLPAGVSFLCYYYCKILHTHTGCG